MRAAKRMGYDEMVEKWKRWNRDASLNFSDNPPPLNARILVFDPVVGREVSCRYVGELRVAFDNDPYWLVGFDPTTKYKLMHDLSDSRRTAARHARREGPMSPDGKGCRRFMGETRES